MRSELKFDWNLGSVFQFRLVAESEEADQSGDQRSAEHSRLGFHQMSWVGEGQRADKDRNGKANSCQSSDGGHLEPGHAPGKPCLPHFHRQLDRKSTRLNSS